MSVLPLTMGMVTFRNFDFKQDAGLDAGQQVKAVTHYGSFGDEDTDYMLTAGIYSPSAPETPIDWGVHLDLIHI